MRYLTVLKALLTLLETQTERVRHTAVRAFCERLQVRNAGTAQGWPAAPPPRLISTRSLHCPSECAHTRAAVIHVLCIGIGRFPWNLSATPALPTSQATVSRSAGSRRDKVTDGPCSAVHVLQCTPRLSFHSVRLPPKPSSPNTLAGSLPRQCPSNLAGGKAKQDGSWPQVLSGIRNGHKSGFFVRSLERWGVPPPTQPST